jgi:hypothetical protein
MKEDNQAQAENKEDMPFMFEINEVYRVDGNNEKFFRPKHR